MAGKPDKKKRPATPQPPSQARDTATPGAAGPLSAQEAVLLADQALTTRALARLRKLTATTCAAINAAHPTTPPKTVAQMAQDLALDALTIRAWINASLRYRAQCSNPTDP